MGKKMPKTYFIKCSLNEVNFTRCNLTGSVFDETNLADTLFNGTDLGTANFITAFNYNIDPEINNLKKATFSLAGLPGLLIKHQLKIR
jgi:fluoroquinolone resistance protein